MARDIESYLRELQEALRSAGADPALVQDALFDAEEYLQAEMAVGGTAGRGTATYEERFAAATRGYGSPDEVAGAYLGIPVDVTSAAGHVAPVIGEAMMHEPPAAAEIDVVGAEPDGPEASEIPGAETGEAAGVPPQTCLICGAELRPAARFCTTCGTAVGVAAPETTAVRTASAVTAPAAPAPAAPAPAAAAAAAAAADGPGAPPHAPVPAGVQAGMAAAGATAATTAATRPGVWQQIFGVFADAAVWKALLYMIISLATGIVYFTVLVTGVSTAAGMSVLIIGVPLFVLVLGIVRAMALFEGRVVEVLLGTRMPRRPRAEPPDVGFFQRLWFWIKDGRTWASMAYMLLMLPLGCIYFTIAVTGIAVGIGLIGSPLWGWAGDYTFIYEGVTYSGWFPAWGIPLAMILGVVVLVAFMHVVKWIGCGHAAFAKAMLVRLSK